MCLRSRADSCVKRAQRLWQRKSSSLQSASSSWDTFSQVFLSNVSYTSTNTPVSSLRPPKNMPVACVLTGSLRYAELLSSDLQKNILAALIRLGAVSKIKGYIGFKNSAWCGKISPLPRRRGKCAVTFLPQSAADDFEGQPSDGELPGRHSG